MNCIVTPLPSLQILNPRVFSSPTSTTCRRKKTIHCSSKYGNFLELKPEHHQTALVGFDLPSSVPRLGLDLVIIGAGPAGMRLAEQASVRGVSVCVVDPAPLSGWPNNYGSWVDELSPLGLSHCFDHTWSTTSVILDHSTAKHLPRPYGRVDRSKLKTHLLQNCLRTGLVSFHSARAVDVCHKEFDSLITCDDGKTIAASLVVDATGFNNQFVEYDQSARNKKLSTTGYQIAHGILAEVESHPFDLDKMVLMDWSNSHLDNEPYLRQSNDECPTFLYAMPFNSNLVFLEETSLVSRPALSFEVVKRRMVARLRHLGIRVKRVIEDEKCVIPMGGPLPRVPQSALALGGAAGMVHPSTGYMLARTMRLATVVAESVCESLGGPVRMVRGKVVRDRVWKDGVWPVQRRVEREMYKFGMETLLKLNLDETRRFFEAFFGLEDRYWQGFLSSNLSSTELGLLSLSLFKHASPSTKLDIVTKCPLPLANMVANLALSMT